MTLPWPTGSSPVATTRPTDAGPTSRHDVEARLGNGRSVVLVLEAPAVAAELLTSPELSLPVELAPSVFWHGSGERDGAAMVDETIVGLGVLHQVTAAWGDTDTIRHFAAEELARFDVVGAGVSKITPRMFAAIGFTPAARHSGAVLSPGATDVWSDFGSAWGVIPRLTYVHRHYGAETTRTQAWFCLHLTPKDLPHLDSLVAQVATIGRKLRTTSFTDGVRVVATASNGTALSDWNDWIDDALEAISSQRLEKVVAARFAEFTVTRPLSTAHTLHSLASRHPDSTRFAFFRGGSVFLGATPERLIAKRGTNVETEALAGTVRRRDAALGGDSTLDFGPKEHKEHSPVLARILAALEPFCATVSYDPSPELRAQEQVLHLRTAVRGTLKAPYPVLSLVRALHPTPAVGGCPTDRALHWIGAHEDFDRGLYAGPVGWIDAHDDGHFYVALRSGVLRNERATLFAGAGIVAGSDPKREFDETALKLQVLLGSLCHAPVGH